MPTKRENNIMSRKFSAIACIVIFFIVLSAVSIYAWVHYWFGSLSFESAMTYLSLPREDIEDVYLNDFLLKMMVAIPLPALLFAVAVRYLYKRNGIARVSFDIIAFVMASALFFVLAIQILRIDDRHDVMMYFDSGSLEATYFDNHYREVRSSQIVFPPRKRNLVMLVLESMESSVTDPNFFGQNLIPRLTGMQKKYPHFRKLFPTEGTLFTMASFSSFLYGAPVILPKRLSLSENPLEVFDPQVPSLLGILEDHGYSVSFILGSDAEHNAMDTLINEDTKQGLLADLDHFLELDPEAAELTSKWGLPDSYLYDKAKTLLTEQAEDQPFASIVLTLNTHNPGVTEPDLPAPFGDYRDSFYQADIMATDFLAWTARQPWAENTTIIVIGDHPNTQTSVGPVALPSDRGKRDVFNMIINAPPNTASKAEKAVGSTWDLAPTILESLGAKVPNSRFGLGTSLFSSKKGLIETVGIRHHDHQIVRNSKRYAELFINDDEPE